ncbi:MAG: hypothetical protein KDD40_05760 [Bdellovibrionales bacterium]|nr:hypothetical protein [Bdellovibrionales bacterium]
MTRLFVVLSLTIFSNVSYANLCTDNLVVQSEMFDEAIDKLAEEAHDIDNLYAFVDKLLKAINLVDLKTDPRIVSRELNKITYVFTHAPFRYNAGLNIEKLNYFIEALYVQRLMNSVSERLSSLDAEQVILENKDQLEEYLFYLSGEVGLNEFFKRLNALARVLDNGNYFTHDYAELIILVVNHIVNTSETTAQSNELLRQAIVVFKNQKYFITNEINDSVLRDFFDVLIKRRVEKASALDYRDFIQSMEDFPANFAGKLVYLANSYEGVLYRTEKLLNVYDNNLELLLSQMIDIVNAYSSYVEQHTSAFAKVFSHSKTGVINSISDEEVELLLETLVARNRYTKLELFDVVSIMSWNKSKFPNLGIYLKSFKAFLLLSKERLQKVTSPDSFVQFLRDTLFSLNKMEFNDPQPMIKRIHDINEVIMNSLFIKMSKHIDGAAMFLLLERLQDIQLKKGESLLARDIYQELKSEGYPQNLREQALRVLTE